MRMSGHGQTLGLVTPVGVCHLGKLVTVDKATVPWKGPALAAVEVYLPDDGAAAYRAEVVHTETVHQTVEPRPVYAL